MANIIRFPVERANESKGKVQFLDGPTAQIIIFPGIRIERHEESGNVAVAK